MKKRYSILALIIVPALAYSISLYFEGRFDLQGSGRFLAIFSMLVLPIFITAVIARVAIRSVWLILATFFFQVWLCGSVSYTFPELRGFAHRVNAQYSSNALRSAARDIIAAHMSGDLSYRTPAVEEDPRLFRNSLLIADSELPAELQDHFAFVDLLQYGTNNRVTIQFAVDQYRGILFDPANEQTEEVSTSETADLHVYQLTRP
jgi:hypothetical protein